MSLNLKDPETHALASELARRLGMSMTKAVALALKETLRAAGDAGPSREARIRRVLEIGRACAARLSPEAKALDHADLLYDERGLPK